MEPSESSKNYTNDGGYNTKENKIVMNPGSIKKLREISKVAQDPNTFFLKHYNNTLLHELFHMASSFYDEKTGISLCGFDKYPADNIHESNRGLTEGMTEILACAGIPRTVEISCQYYIEELLVNQLTLIVGLQPMIDSYFGNLGNKLLGENLCKIDENLSKDLDLFLLIDLNYDLRYSQEKQTILGTIQAKLIEYYYKKIFIDIDNGVSEEEIRKSMNIYKNMLVTKEVLIATRKDPDNYPNLNVSLDSFKNLETEVNQLFQRKVK